MTERHPNSARFHEILKELGELHDRKQADYGRGDDPFANVRSSEEFAVPAWIGAMIRGNDKVSRIKSFISKGYLKNEALEDSLRDLAVYTVIALVLYEQETGREAEPKLFDDRMAELKQEKGAWCDGMTKEELSNIEKHSSVIGVSPESLVEFLRAWKAVA